MNISEKFVELLMERAENPVIENMEKEVQLCLIDYLGCAIAGQKMLDTAVSEILHIMGREGKAPVIGRATKATPMIAALVNAMQAHATELDDGHRYGMLHPGTPVISGMLAAVSSELVSDKKNFFKGIILGYEATCRLAQAIQPGHKLRGFHATGTCGTIGAALGIAFAAGYSKEQIYRVLSAAVTSASGVLEMIDSPSQMKPFTVGQAAMNGYVAACVGKSGLLGPKDPLGGKRGFFKTIAEKVDEKKLLDQQSEYKICERYMKGYAACRHCHPAIEAALILNKTKKIEAENIEKVKVFTYKLAIFGHDQRHVTSISAAKMSTPFSVAISLVTGVADFEGFSENNILNKSIQQLANKVDVIEDEKLTLLSPGKRAARVEIYMKTGECFRYQVDYPLGEPENPMTQEMIRDKFLSLGSYAGEQKNSLELLYNTVFQKEFELETLIDLL